MIMVEKRARVLLIGLAFAVSGCASSKMKDIPAGPVAYELVPATIPGASLGPYTIGAGDTLSVNVFNEPNLSVDKVYVDDGGNIQIPLVGQVSVKGRTTTAIAADISAALGRRYLRDPQVTVALVQPADRIVSVEGEVGKPGSYAIGPDTTLLGALARAGSPGPAAALDQVVVFRNIAGRRAAARFNLADIRAGLAADPTIRDGDVIVVGFSGVSRFWQDVLKASPLFNAFVYSLK